MVEGHTEEEVRGMGPLANTQYLRAFHNNLFKTVITRSPSEELASWLKFMLRIILPLLLKMFLRFFFPLKFMILLIIYTRYGYFSLLGLTLGFQEVFYLPFFFRRWGLISLDHLIFIFVP